MKTIKDFEEVEVFDISEEEQLAQDYAEAEKMISFWENRIDHLEKTIRGIEGLPYELITKYKEDGETGRDIVYRLDDLRQTAKARFNYWLKRRDELEEELRGCEEDDEDDTPYEPYDCVLDPVSEPFDYVALGMGI